MFSENVPESIRKLLIKLRKELNQVMGFGYKGLVKTGASFTIDGEDLIELSEGLYKKVNYGESNQLRLSSIPKGETPICNIIYNKDGYSSHCKDYKEYQEWLENRNETRYVETKEHGQRIDGKNMMHCIRLIRMAQEIGAGKGINVRRPDAEELLSIRRGEVDLDNLIQMADKAIEEMDSIFDNSDLPKKVDAGLVNDLLIKIRREFYNRKK